MEFIRYSEMKCPKSGFFLIIGIQFVHSMLFGHVRWSAFRHIDVTLSNYFLGKDGSDRPLEKLDRMLTINHW